MENRSGIIVAATICGCVLSTGALGLSAFIIYLQAKEHNFIIGGWAMPLVYFTEVVGIVVMISAAAVGIRMPKSIVERHDARN